MGCEVANLYLNGGWFVALFLKQSVVLCQRIWLLEPQNAVLFLVLVF